MMPKGVEHYRSLAKEMCEAAGEDSNDAERR